MSLTFPNLTSIVDEETNNGYTFEHIDKDGYNTLYLKDSNGEIIMYDMSNRPIKSIYEQHMNNLTGDILICGLGCGFIIFPIKDLPGVNSITVLEKDATIIAMMSPYLDGITIIETDAKLYEPTSTFDSIFLDIWNSDNSLEKYSETLRYQEYLKYNGYLSFLDFNSYYKIKPCITVSNRLEKIVPLSATLNGIYLHSGITYAMIPEQIMVPLMNDIIQGATKLEAKIVVSTLIDGTATGKFDLRNYTDSSAIVGSETDLPNAGWSNTTSDWFDLTTVEGKAIRIRTKRVGGSDSNDVQLEGFSLILKASK